MRSTSFRICDFHGTHGKENIGPACYQRVCRADTTGLAVCVSACAFLSHLLCLATGASGRAGRSDVIGGDLDPQDTEC